MLELVCVCSVRLSGCLLCRRVLGRLRDAQEARDTLFAMTMVSQDEILSPADASACAVATALAMSEEVCVVRLSGVLPGYIDCSHHRRILSI